MISGALFRVEAPEDGIRLDRFLCVRVPSAPRHAVAEAIARGSVRVNGRPCRKGGKLAAGDTVSVRELTEEGDIRVRPNPAVPLDVVFADDHLIVVNKPPALPVHPLRPEETRTLANALVARYPETAGLGDQPLFPAFAHRIDTDTSGLVVAARTAPAYAELRRQFRQRLVRKQYWALVEGRVKGDGSVDSWLAHDPARPGRMLVVGAARREHARRPMRALSLYRVLERFARQTLLEVEIKTGVTHQIRCQLASIDHPLVGDKVYGRPGRPSALSRHFLHACRLGFAHPATGAPVSFSSPLPHDLAQHLAALTPPRSG